MNDAEYERQRWIGVDLDATLAHYDEWRGIEHIGAPIPAMVARVRAWLAEGRDVRIFTARVSGSDGRDVARTREVIEQWCRLHIGQVLPVTNVKDFGLHELWDDRAVGVVKNTGARADALAPDEIDEIAGLAACGIRSGSYMDAAEAGAVGMLKALQGRWPNVPWRVFLDRSLDRTFWNITAKEHEPREHFVPRGGSCIHCGKKASELGVEERDE